MNPEQRIALVLVVVVAAVGGWVLGRTMGEDRTWDRAEQRAWRVRADGVCDGVSFTTRLLPAAILGARELPGSSWRETADYIDEQVAGTISLLIYNAPARAAVQAFIQPVLDLDGSLGEAWLQAFRAAGNEPTSSAASIGEHYQRAPDDLWVSVCEFGISPADLRG